MVFLSKSNVHRENFQYLAIFSYIESVFDFMLVCVCVCVEIMHSESRCDVCQAVKVDRVAEKPSYNVYVYSSKMRAIRIIS